MKTSNENICECGDKEKYHRLVRNSYGKKELLCYGLSKGKTTWCLCKKFKYQSQDEPINSGVKGLNETSVVLDTSKSSEEILKERIEEKFLKIRGWQTWENYHAVREDIEADINTRKELIDICIALTREACEKDFGYEELERRAWNKGVKEGQKAERERILEMIEKAINEEDNYNYSPRFILEELKKEVLKNG